MDSPGDGHVEELPLNEPRCYPNYISESVASDSEEDYIVLKIRLRRTGAKKQPRYRVVVAESSAPRDGAFVEILGWYNPQADPAQVVINTEKAAEWIKRGAQPSDRVAYLLQQAGAGQPEAPVAEPGPAEVAEVEVRETTVSARGRSRTKRASAETAAAATSEQGEGGAAAAPAVSGVAAEIPASEAPEEEGSAGASSS